MNPYLIGGAAISLGLALLIKKLKDKNMNYEIDFLPVGNGDTSGDAIAMRYVENGKNDYKIMVIDGGTQDSGGNLVEHIKNYYDTDRVDYVINTHPDQDHASGLSVVMEELEVGELWIHRPWEHTSEIIHHFKDQRMTEDSLERHLKDKFSAAYALEKIATKNNIPIKEPYQGQQIGLFTVMSPDKDWYLHTLIPDFNKTPDKKTTSLQSATSHLSESIKYVAELLGMEMLREDGETSADNESSVILYTEFNDEGIMFTGDAGIKALNKAVDYFDSQHPLIYIYDKLSFIQVPHHGSRRNVSPSILNKLLGDQGQHNNKQAIVSAGEDSTKHPRKMVVNAFIRRGCKVYATKGKTICKSCNISRDGWSATTPLPFSNTVESYDD